MKVVVCCEIMCCVWYVSCENALRFCMQLRQNCLRNSFLKFENPSIDLHVVVSHQLNTPYPIKFDMMSSVVLDADAPLDVSTLRWPYHDVSIKLSLVEIHLYLCNV